MGTLTCPERRSTVVLGARSVVAAPPATVLGVMEISRQRLSHNKKRCSPFTVKLKRRLLPASANASTKQ